MTRLSRIRSLPKVIGLVRLSLLGSDAYNILNLELRREIAHNCLSTPITIHTDTNYIQTAVHEPLLLLPAILAVKYALFPP